MLPVVLVKEKLWTVISCVNYYKLNSTTKRDVQPLFDIDGSMYTVVGARYLVM